MSNTIEGAILQINGGTTAPTQLESRELYVTTGGYLYYGPMLSTGGDRTNKSAALVNAGNARTSDNATIARKLVDNPENEANSNGHLIYTNNVKLTSSELNLDGVNIIGNSSTSMFGINRLTATTTETSTLTVNSTATLYGSVLLANNYSYGETLPTSATEGQLFFLIV